MDSVFYSNKMIFRQNKYTIDLDLFVMNRDLVTNVIVYKNTGHGHILRLAVHVYSLLKKHTRDWNNEWRIKRIVCHVHPWQLEHPPGTVTSDEWLIRPIGLRGGLGGLKSIKNSIAIEVTVIYHKLPSIAAATAASTTTTASTPTATASCVTSAVAVRICKWINQRLNAIIWTNEMQ